jgi:O-antigen ligase
VTGDRVLGLVLLGPLAWLAVTRRLHWTRVHSALALFVGGQVVTTLANVGPWPQGPKFVTIYLLGFAGFAVAAEWCRGRGQQERLATLWIVVGATVALLGACVAAWANLTHTYLWGTDVVHQFREYTPGAVPVFGARGTVREPNLLASFLLVPFTLGLWRWRSDGDAPSARGPLIAGLAAIVLGLVFSFTRAAWIAAVGIIALWCWRERPPWRRVAALVAMFVVAFGLQAAVVGESALRFRMLDPLRNAFDKNVANRVEIVEVVVRSWATQPAIGHGAGSINRLSVVRPSGKRYDRIWSGNMVTFVLHDSGVLGLVTLVGLAVIVAGRLLRAVRRGAALAWPLLAIGAALAFAYQFTHALWQMYPYVFLGLLTAATDDG